ncbi:hypothetical protein [Nostoc sp.]|uniref:hypothetical protein n=1 Tax=Nostoc sp. TaxID=1180 RepID=UPI002FF80E1B
MVCTSPRQKIPIDKLQATLASLEKLEEKDKEELSLPESVYFMRVELESALKKGYSYQNLSENLKTQKIKVLAVTFKQYLTEIEKEKRFGKRGVKLKPILSAENYTQISTESSVMSQSASVTGDSLVLETSLEKLTPEIQIQQESKDEIKASDKTTKTTRRQPPKSSKPGKDVSDEFNKY